MSILHSTFVHLIGYTENTLNCSQIEIKYYWRLNQHFKTIGSLLCYSQNMLVFLLCFVNSFALQLQPLASNSSITHSLGNLSTEIYTFGFLLSTCTREAYSQYLFGTLRTDIICTHILYSFFLVFSCFCVFFTNLLDTCTNLNLSYWFISKYNIRTICENHFTSSKTHFPKFEPEEISNLSKPSSDHFYSHWNTAPQFCTFTLEGLLSCCCCCCSLCASTAAAL